MVDGGHRGGVAPEATRAGRHFSGHPRVDRALGKGAVVDREVHHLRARRPPQQVECSISAVQTQKNSKKKGIYIYTHTTRTGKELTSLR